jgi:MFS family permease
MSQALESPVIPAPAAQSPKQLRRYAGYVFWLLWFANFLNYADRYAFLAIGDHVRVEFNISYTEYGLLASSFLFVYTFSILPLGLLADRIKRKTVVAGGITFWSLVTAVTALVTNFPALFATRAALGLGEGSYFPASTSMLAATSPHADRAKVMSRWNTGLLVGLGVGFVGAGALYSAFHNQWRPVFYFFGIPGLILALLIALVREPPRSAVDEASPETVLARKGLVGIWQDITQLWQIKTLRITVALQALSFFVTSATLVFIVPLLDNTFPNAALSPTVIIGVGTVVGGIIGLLAGGAIADRFIRRYPGARVLVSGWSFVLAVPFFIGSIIVDINSFGLAPNVRLFGLFLPFFVITVGLLQVSSGPLTAVSQDVVTPIKRAAAVGLTLLLSHALGDLFSPTIAGGLSDVFGKNAFFQQFGVTVGNAPGYAFLVTGVPILLAAGIVGIWGARFVQKDEAAARAS